MREPYVPGAAVVVVVPLPLAADVSVRDVRVQVIGHSAAYHRDTLRRTVRTDGQGRFSLVLVRRSSTAERRPAEPAASDSE